MKQPIPRSGVSPFMHFRIARQGGFTLLEMLISMAVFSIGMLGLTSLFAMQMNINANTIRHSVANNLALGAIEEAKSVPYYLMRSWNPTQVSATVPCQGDVALNQGNRVDCLRPDTADNTVPPAPYNRLVSDAAFVALSTLADAGLVQAGRDYTKGMEVKRTFTIQPDTPAANMKTITAQVEWRVAGTTKVHTVAYTTVRDMDVR